MQIIKKNFSDEPTDISYNFKEAILNTKKIKIIKDGELTTYQLVFYNIKDIYKNMIDKTERESNGNNNQYDLEKIRKIYEYYEKMNDEDVEISLNIKLYNEKNDETKTSIYLKAYTSKIGIEVNNKKKYTDDIQSNSIKLNENNSLMLNNYPKEVIDKFLKLLYNNTQKVLKKKIAL